MDNKLIHCVESVYNYWYKYVYKLRIVFNRHHLLGILLCSTGDSRQLTHNYYTAPSPSQSTANMSAGLVLGGWLSTVSTPPITMTIIYIIRKEQL